MLARNLLWTLLVITSFCDRYPDVLTVSLVG